jgi:hypothetical protein
MNNPHASVESEGRKMELGLAVDIEELLTLDSQILGGSVAERLFDLPKLTRRSRRP